MWQIGADYYEKLVQGYLNSGLIRAGKGQGVIATPFNPEVVLADYSRLFPRSAEQLPLTIPSPILAHPGFVSNVSTIASNLPRFIGVEDSQLRVRDSKVGVIDSFIDNLRFSPTLVQWFGALDAGKAQDSSGQSLRELSGEIATSIAAYSAWRIMGKRVGKQGGAIQSNVADEKMYTEDFRSTDEELELLTQSERDQIHECLFDQPGPSEIRLALLLEQIHGYIENPPHTEEEQDLYAAVLAALAESAGGFFMYASAEDFISQESLD